MTNSNLSSDQNCSSNKVIQKIFNLGNLKQVPNLSVTLYFIAVEWPIIFWARHERLLAESVIVSSNGDISVVLCSIGPLLT